MKVASRIAVSYRIAALTVAGAAMCMVAGSWLTSRYVLRMHGTYQQMVALHALHGEIQKEGGHAHGEEGHGVDPAFAVLQDATARERQAPGAAHDDEGGYLERFAEVHARTEAATDAAERARLLLERDALVDAWIDEEEEELEGVTQEVAAPLRAAAAVAAVVGLLGLFAVGLQSQRTIGWIGRRIDGLIQGAARIGRGDLAQPIVVHGRDELATLAGALNQLMQDLAGSQERVQTLQAELQAQNQKLASALVEAESARDRAERANQAKDAFLATMSHELRTPLNAIIGYTEMIAEDLDPGAARDDCRRVLAASEHLLTLISDVLDLAKLGAGKLELKPEWVELDALFQGALDGVRPLAERNGTALELHLAGARRFRCDPVRLRQIVVNLAGNACKFTERGRVDVHVQVDEGSCQVRIEDTGIGIPADKLAAIFDPFVQADASTTRRYGGTGLGLAIVRRLVELMDGDIRVQSEPGRGTRFDLDVPEAA